MSPRRRVLLACAWTSLASAGCDGGGDGAGDRFDQRAARLIYGADDRREVYDAAGTEALAAMARASLLAVGLARELAPAGTANGGGAFVRVLSPAAETRLGLCPAERFARQVSFALCSGFAVAPHLALTAAHCLDLFGAGDLVAVSGFYQAAPETLAPLPADQVRVIAEVVVADPSRDVALVRLGGAPLTPVVLAPELPAVGDALSSVNHGMGVPAKLGTGAHVFSVDARSFVSDLDAFGGASGAPVVDDAGRVAGILTSGAPDYQQTEAGCLTASHLPDGSIAADELVQHARLALDDLCQRRFVPELCDGAAPEGGCAWAPPARGPGGSRGAAALAVVLVLTATRRQSRSEFRSR